MDRFIDHTTVSLSATGASTSWRRRFARLALAPLLALSVLSATLLPAGATHAAAQSAKPDLDVVSCKPVDDPVDYGDGIDWYTIQYTYRNKGIAAAPAFKYHVRPAFGQDMFSGQIKNEAFVVLELWAAATGPIGLRVCVGDQEGRRPAHLGHVPRQQRLQPGHGRGIDRKQQPLHALREPVALPSSDRFAHQRPPARGMPQTGGRCVAGWAAGDKSPLG